MKNIFHRIAAVIGGTLFGVLVVMVVEGISSQIYKMPADLDMNDTEAMTQWINSLPIGAFLFVLAAWALGCFAGAFVARRIAPERSAVPGVIAWVLLTIASISTLILVPHPVWFSVVAVLACLLFGLLGLIAAAPKVYVVACTRKINAPIEKVFKTLATIDQFCKAVPGIQNIEFLSDIKYGVGTRFRETRLMNGKEASTELEVTELVENERVRMVSDAGGTIWDTVFEVKQADGMVEMNMQMDAIPHRFPARIITPMIIGMVGRFVEQDMDSVKEFCEKSDS